MYQIGTAAPVETPTAIHPPQTLAACKVVLSTVFDLAWSLQPAVLATGFVATITLTLLVGFLSTYRILGQPPLSVLRHE